eukprot:SAG22_NODE_524_length_9488_cov_16.150602_5_plen_112_part_00
MNRLIYLKLKSKPRCHYPLLDYCRDVINRLFDADDGFEDGEDRNLSDAYDQCAATPPANLIAVFHLYASIADRTVVAGQHHPERWDLKFLKLQPVQFVLKSPSSDSATTAP